MPKPSPSGAIDRGLIDRLCEEFSSRRVNGERVTLADFARRCRTRSDRVELLKELLPDEIVHFRAIYRRDPCCEELCDENPSVAPELQAAYPQIDPDFRYAHRAGDYLVTQVLSDGSSQAFVVKARHVKLPREVALKYNRTEADRARVHCEGKVLEKLQSDNARGSHPHIVHCDKCFPDGDSTYLALEYLKGATLAKTYGPSRPAKLAEVVLIGDQIADALAYCHDRGVYHCDVSINNIVQAGPQRAVLIDFGLAVERPDGSDPNSPLPDLGGTREFFSPERLRGEMRCGAKADIYALGAVLYWLLTGDAPPQFNVAKKKHPQLAKVPRSLRAVFAKALAGNPEDRYQSAQEFQAALQRWQQRRRHYKTVSLVAVAASIVGGAFVAGTLLRDKSTDAIVGERMAGILENQLVNNHIAQTTLATALSRVDVETLRDVARNAPSPATVEAALAAPSLGSYSSIAADFLFGSRNKPEAIDWLRDRIREGLDPNLVIEHRAFERSLLNAALRAGNKHAVCMLLDEGANPHPYERILGKEEYGHPFLFPLGRLGYSNFSTEEKREIAEKMLRCGVVVARPHVLRDLYGELSLLKYSEGAAFHSDAAMAHKGMLLLKDEWGLPHEPTPTIREGHRSPIVEAATRKGPYDWEEFVARAPYRFQAQDQHNHRLISSVDIHHVIGVMGDTIYFMGEAVYYGRVQNCLIQTDIRGVEWTVYHHWGRDEAAVGGYGWLYTKQGELPYAESGYRRWHRGYRFLFEPLKKTAIIDQYVYDLIYTDADAAAVDARVIAEKKASELRAAELAAEQEAREQKLAEEQRQQRALERLEKEKLWKQQAADRERESAAERALLAERIRKTEAALHARLSSPPDAALKSTILPADVTRKAPAATGNASPHRTGGGFGVILPNDRTAADRPESLAPSPAEP